MTRMTGTTRVTGMTRVTGVTGMTGTTRVTGMTRMTGRSGVTVIDRVTRMSRTFKVTCLANGKKFPKLLLTDLFEYWPNEDLSNRITDRLLIFILTEQNQCRII